MVELIFDENCADAFANIFHRKIFLNNHRVNIKSRQGKPHDFPCKAAQNPKNFDKKALFF